MMGKLPGLLLAAKLFVERILQGKKPDSGELRQFLSNDDTDHLLHRISDEDSLTQYRHAKRALERAKEAHWRDLETRILGTKRIPWYSVAAAAVFIGLLSYTGYRYLPSLNKTNMDGVIPKDEVIYLKSADGTVTIIDPEKEGEVSNSNGKNLGLQYKNTLSYTGAEYGEVGYNEIYVPLGRTFKLVLSDSTVVHINAGTRLKYPTKFPSGFDREVQLTDGEAFFEVSKDRDRPFLIHVDAMDIEVLGTKFNVSSYPEDPEVNTALVEGLVKIYGNDSVDDKLLLTPGRLAAWDKSSGEVNTKEVDLGLYVAWVQGKLVFRKTAFSDMLRKLERAYDVEIICRNADLNNTVFSATFDVNIETIEQVLDYVSKNVAFTYARNKKQILIN